MKSIKISFGFNAFIQLYTAEQVEFQITQRQAYHNGVTKMKFSALSLKNGNKKQLNGKCIWSCRVAFITKALIPVGYHE